jgi:hypothetical protein
MIRRVTRTGIALVATVTCAFTARPATAQQSPGAPVTHAQTVAAVRMHAPKPVKTGPAALPSRQSAGVATVCSFGTDIRVTAKKPASTPAVKVIQLFTYARRALNFYKQHLPALSPHLCIRWPKHFPGSVDRRTVFHAYNAAGGSTGTAASCWIDVNSALSSQTSDRFYEYLMAFWTFACYEAEFSGLDVYVNPPYGNWVQWGMGEWASAQIAPDLDLDVYWKEYFKEARTPLFMLSFAAIGFYSHLEESGTSPWTIMRRMLRAADDTDAFNQANGNTNTFLDSWASSYYRFKSFSSAWNTSGPGIPKPYLAVGDPSPVTVGLSPTQRDVPAYTQGLFILRVQPNVDMLDITPIGSTRFSDGHIDNVVSSRTSYCIAPSRCACPSGTSYSGPKPPTVGPDLLALAVTGGQKGAKLNVRGLRMKDVCKPAPTTCSTGSPGTLLMGGLARYTSSGGTRLLMDARHDAGSCNCPVGSWVLDLSSVGPWMTWQLDHLQQFPNYTGFTSASGEERLTINADNTATLTAKGFTLNLVSSDKAPGTWVLNGTATATVKMPQLDQMLFLYATPSNFTYTLSGGGQTGTFNTFFPIATAWTPGKAQTFQCTGDSLHLHYLGTDTPPLIFHPTAPSSLNVRGRDDRHRYAISG